jgi:tetratricopeptide (TPR) repeat protein
MAKQRRPARAAAPVARKKSAAKKGARASARGRTVTSPRAGLKAAVTKTRRPAKTARHANSKAAPTGPQAAGPAPAPARKPSFYEAVAIYERGVQALQRHDYSGAADQFRGVLEGYPEERELLERARLYLRVCERETARQPAPPRTAAERVYAATIALNSGDHAAAADHLQRALSDEPDNDHAHYTMAVALGMRGRPDEALDYLGNAIGLNPENRSLALQDPDLEPVRGHRRFGEVLDTPAARRRTRPRR